MTGHAKSFGLPALLMAAVLVLISYGGSGKSLRQSSVETNGGTQLSTTAARAGGRLRFSRGSARNKMMSFVLGRGANCAI